MMILCDRVRGVMKGRKVACPDCGATFPLHGMGRQLLLPMHDRGEEVR